MQNRSDFHKKYIFYSQLLIRRAFLVQQWSNNDDEKDGTTNKYIKSEQKRD
jgi:hypothetical protein